MSKKAKKEKTNEETIKALDAIDVCKICQLRITGIECYGDYTVDGTPVKEGSHCCLCLGILEGYTLTSVTKKVAEMLEAYDSTTFHIGISLPHCVVLRQAAVIAYLIDNGHGHEAIKRGCMAVKTVVKFFLVKLITKLSNKEQHPQSHLSVTFDFKYAADTKEISTLDHLLKESQASGMKRNSEGDILIQYKTESVQKLIRELPSSCVNKYVPCPPHALPEPCECDWFACHKPIYIGGRYNKYTRILSQKSRFIDDVRQGETSVFELIGGPLKEFIRGGDIKFHKSGREDVDVQLLGSGRPFAVEVFNPKKTVITKEQMAKVEAEINASTNMISVHDLQVVTKSVVELMKKREEGKLKTYIAKLCCHEEISDDNIKSLNLMKDIELKQKTPIEQLHRQVLATRVRKVHEIELKRTNKQEYYELNVVTQAGTYIKELIHGDLGRTEPSLRTILGLPIDLVQLAEIPVTLNWPPRDTVKVEESE